LDYPKDRIGRRQKGAGELSSAHLCHDNGEKVFSGKKISRWRPHKNGEMVIEILARQPLQLNLSLETGSRFVNDTPASLVD